MFRKLLVGTDGSDSATIAVAHGVELAKALDAEITVMSVYAPPRPDAPEVISSRVGDPTADIARAILRDVNKQFEAKAKLTTRAEEGNAAESLVDIAEAEGFELIIVGNRGMAGASRFMLGNVPNKVSHHAPASVLIVDTVDSQEPGYGKMLVGTDGSDAASKAVAEAVDLAKAMGASLTVATVAPSEEAGDRVLASVREKYPDVETRVLVGEPADEMVGLAERDGYDLMIVGNKGMTGARRFLLGSVPNKISHHAPTSLLILNTTGG
jgi:nucleotide-binding universal stress UspA family protein